jgi:DNA-binding winged helix-turn-helix (wHTH) protein
MRVCFGGYFFDGDARVLYFGSDAVHLTVKAFQLLDILLEKRPTAVSKDEIAERLWPNVFVADGSLANLAYEIRTALGEHAGFLRTVRGFGYAFCGEVVKDPGHAMADRPLSSCRLVSERRTYLLLEGENRIGRSGSCDLQLNCSAVSRSHARIVVARGRAYIEDLGSRNGTHVRGCRVDGRADLQDGDRIEIGSVKLFLEVRNVEVSTDPLASPGRESG